MSVQWKISASVGAGGVNRTVDTYIIQFLLNAARARMRQPPIGLDGVAGNETVGAIRDFQYQSFGPSKVDGRVDPNYGTLRRLVEIHNEPALVSPKTYVRGYRDMYKVEVGIDGRIFVQPGDWVSKYSAAMYGDYWHIQEFGRMENGQMTRLANPDMIRAGEVIYHLPTWQAFMNGKTKVQPPPAPPLPLEMKKQITDSAIGHDFRMPGDNGVKLLKRLAEWMKWAEPVVDVLTIIQAIAETASDAFAMVKVAVDTYKAFADLCDAWDSGELVYALRGAAYSITAWAFNETCPSKSEEIWSYTLHYDKDPERLKRMQRAWDRAVEEARASNQRYAREKLEGVPPGQREEVWKAALRAAGDGSKVKLCKTAMKALGDKYMKGRMAVEREFYYKYIDQVPYPR
jgi:peptidoglycan hydrolase-like protein with peptidoglycan-binding domain